MAKIDKRQILINYCKEHGQIKTSEANHLLEKFYYCNHTHYVSEILSRLVKSNVFERINKGVYIMRKTEIESNKNQTTLF